MRAVAIREAKARLNALVEAAERGEQIVLMRGAKHVALIVPLSEEDLEVSGRLTDAQAERLWRQSSGAPGRSEKGSPRRSRSTSRPSTCA
jgi:prevent-host-death family protein